MPSVRRSFQCEYARSTGSRSSTIEAHLGIRSATRCAASGWNMYSGAASPPGSGRRAATPDGPLPLGRKVRAVPGLATGPVLLEVVRGLGVPRREKARHQRMLDQVVPQRRGAAPLRADDKEVRQRTAVGGAHAVPHERMLHLRRPRRRQPASPGRGAIDDAPHLTSSRSCRALFSGGSHRQRSTLYPRSFTTHARPLNRWVRADSVRQFGGLTPAVPRGSFSGCPTTGAENSESSDS